MNEDIELSDKVIAALEANRKIEAIKVLRKEKNLGLKEAKDVVDAYIADNPRLAQGRPGGSGPGLVPLLLAAAVTAALYFAYKALS